MWYYTDALDGRGESGILCFPLRLLQKMSTTGQNLQRKSIAAKRKLKEGHEEEKRSVVLSSFLFTTLNISASGMKQKLAIDARALSLMNTITAIHQTLLTLWNVL